MSLNSATFSRRSSTASRNVHTLRDEWEETNMNCSRLPTTSGYRMRAPSTNSGSSLQSILKNPIRSNGGEGGGGDYNNRDRFTSVTKSGLICLNTPCTGEQVFQVDELTHHQRWFPTHTSFKKIEYIEEEVKRARSNINRPRIDHRPPATSRMSSQNNRSRPSKKVSFENSNVSVSGNSSRSSARGDTRQSSPAKIDQSVRPTVPPVPAPVSRSARLSFLTNPPHHSAKILQSQLQSDESRPPSLKSKQSQQNDAQHLHRTLQGTKTHQPSTSITIQNGSHPEPSKKLSVEPVKSSSKDDKVTLQHHFISCQFCDGIFQDQTIMKEHIQGTHFSSMMLEMSFNSSKYLDRDEGGGVSPYATSE